jgi:hypothetical protein
MSRLQQANLAVILIAATLLGLGWPGPPTRPTAPTVERDLTDRWAAPLQAAAHARANASYWSTGRTRQQVEARGPEAESLAPEPVALALEGPAPAAPPAPVALRHAEPPELKEPDPALGPPPLPVVAARLLEPSRTPLRVTPTPRTFAAAQPERTGASEQGHDRARAAAGGTDPTAATASAPAVSAVVLTSCSRAPRSDTLTGTYVRHLEGGRGHTLLGGVVEETRGPGGPGRATAEAPREVADPVEVVWDLRLANGSSARDGIPIHVVDEVLLRAADGTTLRIPAPQEVIPLAEAGCTEEPGSVRPEASGEGPGQDR